MVRRVFFCFHYDRDIWRVSQIRNCWVTKGIEEAGYIDSASWEKLKRSGDTEIERWIKNQLNGTSVTVVLIGAGTYGRQWVNYEIEQSINKGNGFLGIYINNVLDSDRRRDDRGQNPLNKYQASGVLLSSKYETFDWVNDNGYDKCGDWIEEAARRAGR